MSTTHKSLPKGLKDLECKNGTLTVQPPIPYIPPIAIDLHEKRDTKKIKVKLPNGTNFLMTAFGQGNNKEYLVHVIAVKHLLEQKGTVQDIWKAFQAVLEVRKLLELLLKASDGKTKVEKDERKKKLSAIKKDLKAAGELAVAETLKAYKLFRCFMLARRKHNGTRLFLRCTLRTPG
jgi:hypothetical protein